MGNSQTNQKAQSQQKLQNPVQHPNVNKTLTSTDINTNLFDWEKDPSVNKNLDFEIWYPLLSDYTMKSTLIECTKEEIEAITISCDEHRPTLLSISDNNNNNNQILSKLTDIHKESLKNLELKIDKFISENNLSNKGIFIRFSKRSPKDSVLRMNKDKFYKDVENNAIKIFKIQKNLEKMHLNYNKNLQIVNAIIRGMTVSSCSNLCCYSGSYAINLIIWSQRIFQDFKIGSLINDNFNPKLILREFNHFIDFEYEFRIFIFKNNITAITQYNSLIYLNKLIKNKLIIKNKIIEFWKNNIHKNMEQNGITSYVLDLGLLKQNNNVSGTSIDIDQKDNNNNDEFKFILIELNPFCTKAGAMLFDWKKDVKIMTSPPVTFRVLEKPFDKKPDKLNAELAELFDNLSVKLQSL